MTKKQSWYKAMIDNLIKWNSGKVYEDDLCGDRYEVQNEEYLEYYNQSYSYFRGVGMVIRDGKVREYHLYGLSADRDTETEKVTDKWEVLSTREWKRFEKELRRIYNEVADVRTFKEYGM